MEVKVGDVVMPGDTVIFDTQPKATKEKVVLGPGLRRDGETIFACKSGILKHRKPSIYYIDSYQKRYVPARGEDVVGIVTQKVGDIFKVDIGASEPASLSYLAFEGTSKKNRPDVQIGDAVFAKLLLASKDTESELVCVDGHGKKGKLGVLDPGGMLLSCSLNLIRKIRDPDNPFLREFAKEQAYELAIGMNGKVWLRARSVKETIALANALLAAEFTPYSEMRSLCSRVSQIVLENS